jgi:hypothetical protein
LLDSAGSDGEPEGKFARIKLDRISIPVGDLSGASGAVEFYVLKIFGFDCRQHIQALIRRLQKHGVSAKGHGCMQLRSGVIGLHMRLGGRKH